MNETPPIKKRSIINLNIDYFKLIVTLLLIAIFFFITYEVVQPFIFGFFWAVMVVVTTWPMMIAIQKKLFYKRYLAVIVMCFIIGLFFIIPTVFITLNIAKNSTYVIEWAKKISENGLPLFNKLLDIPYIGEELHQKWLDLSQDGVAELITQFQSYINLSLPWAFEQILNIGSFIFHCGVMIICSAVLYYNGESICKFIYHFSTKISPTYGIETLMLAGRSIRAVSMGIIVTATFLAILGGSCMALTNVPFPGILTLLLFICCVIQIGPSLVLLMATAWQFYTGNITYTIILLVCTLVLATLDSIMRILLIKKDIDLPFFLILFGVIGGMIAFGLMGLFIGPVILAIAHNTMSVWMRIPEEEE